MIARPAAARTRVTGVPTQRVPQNPLYLSVDTAQVVGCPVLDLGPDTWVDAQQVLFALRHDLPSRRAIRRRPIPS